jgi:hypothetical protein
MLFLRSRFREKASGFPILEASGEIARSLDENASVSGRSLTETLNRSPARPAWRYATDYLIRNKGRRMSIAIANFNCDELQLVAPPVRRSPNRTDSIEITRTCYDDYAAASFGVFHADRENQRGNSAHEY